MAFSSVEGEELIRRVLKEAFKINVRDHQAEAIGVLLDGRDVLSVTSTGSGKTETLIQLMHVISHLARNPSLSPARAFPTEPVILVVCPTKSLEENMGARILGAGIDALVINRDTLEREYKKGRNLYKEAVRIGSRVILVAPEQLASKGFESILANSDLCSRLRVMAIDEAHLMNSWGKTFRKAYREVGWVRARFTNRIPVFAATATLQPGAATERVLELLGFEEGAYQIIRHSNERRDIRIIMRELTHGLDGDSHPSLYWLLNRTKPALVFCKTIARGYRLARALVEEAVKQQKTIEIRLYNSLHSLEYNSQTLAFVHSVCHSARTGCMKARLLKRCGSHCR
ncbi:P-loop containing nucleoside triphosphate hydrolase protein [Coniophora puteana RWD-64-598 SS2]|uniref:p-loop containing nucleoside triphosphate hydrolase protein n=1 Tax=Coniophora puteana (strain RWD-64-598) TaxID=741705 RepID=R7SE34_CONPW|nr:P-loop containing nucleoside triphosphate hydrolase protein [Coniophora puteana RWD-64-598 SS2]EIW74433.1 P-loop containing nucleoside triphosphate hydrolase protein [Coniophora puteana RWD-64-598 SS2]